jgi:hypothetical protein
VTSDGNRPAFAGSRFEPFVEALLALRKALWHHGLDNDAAGRAMSNEQHAQEIAMLRAEVEMLMSERQALLRATGAAAVFVANLDSESLPEDTYAVADILAHALNDLSEDTLRDALELVQPAIESARAEQKEQ